MGLGPLGTHKPYSGAHSQITQVHTPKLHKCTLPIYTSAHSQFTQVHTPKVHTCTLPMYTSTQSQCLLAVAYSQATGQGASPSGGASSRTSSTKCCATTGQASCPWQTVARTPTAASSSSPPFPATGWTTSTLFLAGGLHGMVLHHNHGSCSARCTVHGTRQGGASP